MGCAADNRSGEQEPSAYSVKPGCENVPLTGSTYEPDGAKGHDISLKRGEQIGLVAV